MTGLYGIENMLHCPGKETSFGHGSDPHLSPRRFSMPASDHLPVFLINQSDHPAIMKSRISKGLLKNQEVDFGISEKYND
jgi:hypothetical protein